MTCRLTGLTYSGATILKEEDSICLVRCACGQEFPKDRVGFLEIRAKGYVLRCWRCKRKHQSELAKAQADKRGGWK